MPIEPYRIVSAKVQNGTRDVDFFAVHNEATVEVSLDRALTYLEEHRIKTKFEASASASRMLSNIRIGGAKIVFDTTGDEAAAEFVKFLESRAEPYAEAIEAEFAQAREHLNSLQKALQVYVHI